MSGLLDTNIVTQVGIIVRDIETTKRKLPLFWVWNRRSAWMAVSTR